MRFQELIEQTRTVHSFTSEKIEDRTITGLIDYALMAPNHKFTFPWKFILIGEETQQDIFNHALKLKFGDSITDDDRLSMAEKLLNPRMLFLVQKKSDDPFTAKEDYATLACSVQILALSLSEIGIGYKWSTAKFTQESSLYKKLKLDSNKDEIIGCILIGKAKGEPKKRVRPSVSEVLTIIP